MFKSLANYFTRKAVEKQNSVRQKQFLNWDKLEKIALILGNEAGLNKSQLDKFTEESKKYIDVFFIEINSKQATYGDWHCFTKKDKTFLKLPKSDVLNSLNSKKYNLVINTCSDSLFATTITSQLNAMCKCGANNLFGELDIIIEKNPSKNTIDYLKEVKRYLEMIRTD